MITIQNGRANVPNVGNFAVIDMAARAEALETRPDADHAIHRIGNALGCNGLDVRLRSLLGRDNAHTAPRRSQVYDRLVEVAIMKVGQSVNKAKKLKANTDLRPEIVAKRVKEALAEGWASSEEELGKIKEDLARPVELAEAVYREAWTLPKGEDFDPMLQELQDQEVRNLFRGMAQPEQIKIISEQSRNGNVLFFRILESDPLNMIVPSLPPETWTRYKAQALEAAGLGWVEAMRQDAYADQTHVNALVEIFKGGLAVELEAMAA